MSFLSKKAALAAACGLVTIPGYHALSLEASTTAELAPSHTRYRVEITNLTRGQIFSPPVVATHTKDLPALFTVGTPASAELAFVAEDAVNQPLITQLLQSNEVGDVQIITGLNGPILPGETASMVLLGGGKFKRISLVGMLVITNDAFFGLNGVELKNKGLSHRSPAYDAGSEANNELCAFIPGPPCGNGGVRATAGAEGYVHVHAGIHGIGDLAAADFDWRNDVAQIRITRLR